MVSFSVIIPTFNVEDKIADSLRSALDAQAPFEEVEVLVMDGASTDNTVRIAREWAARDSRVQVWSEPDKGLYDAMNKGVARATGQMLYFLGAGDTLHPGALGQVATASGDWHGRLLIYGKVWFPEEGCEYGTRFELCDLARRNLPHQATFYGHEIFELVGGYNLNYPIYADHEFNWRCFIAPGVETRFVDLVLADYEGGGLSAQRTDAQFMLDWPRLVWKGGGFTPWLCLQLYRRFPPERLRVLGTLRALVSRRG